MASPVVAGIVALLLEANPEAWWYEIKNRVISSAVQDTFTGNNLPDNYWGYGKVNAFDALFVNAIYGCTNADALNFNSNAAFDDGSCILPVYGCLDANALNYDSLANVSDTCIYYVFNNVKDENSLNYFSLYPNPANDKITVKYLLNKEVNAQLIISDVLGNIVYSESLKGSSGNIQIETSLFSKGVYVCQLVSENKTISVNKFLKY
jgi:hypothetical protein